MSIPTVVVDEHHEAFYVWHYFIEKGFIEKTNNYLLHIDHHEDMECGEYNWDLSKLTSLPHNTEEAKQFTYKCLGIADFITPAIYQDIFSTVHLLTEVVPAPIKIKEQYVKYHDNENSLSFGDYLPYMHTGEKINGNSPYHFFTKKEGGLHPTDIIIARSIVLDIDLDYFCWDNSLSTVSEKRIEITAEAYINFVSNKNHPFRILPKKCFEVEQFQNKYFLVYKQYMKPDPIADEATIVNRINNLVNYLKQLELRPKVIDICRSSYSGYLPQPRAAFVEKELLKRLSSVLDIRMESC